MARPRKSNPRNCQLNIGFTPTELESIRKRAAALGMRTVHFGRAMLLDQASQRMAMREADGNMQRLIYSELSRLGNNLNQMMRHLHQTGDPLPSDLEPLLKDIREIIERRVQR